MSGRRNVQCHEWYVFAEINLNFEVIILHNIQSCRIFRNLRETCKFSWNLAKITGTLKIFTNLAERHGFIYDIKQENIHGKREKTEWLWYHEWYALGVINSYLKIVSWKIHNLWSYLVTNWSNTAKEDIRLFIGWHFRQR